MYPCQSLVPKTLISVCWNLCLLRYLTTYGGCWQSALVMMLSRSSTGPTAHSSLSIQDLALSWPLHFYHAIKMLVSSFKDSKLLQTKGSRIRLTQGEKVPLQTDSLLGSVSIPATKCMNLKLLGMQRRSKDTGAGEWEQYSTSIWMTFSNGQSSQHAFILFYDKGKNQPWSRIQTHMHILSQWPSYTHNHSQTPKILSSN